MKLKKITRSGYHNFKRTRFASTSAILMMVVALSFIMSLIYVQVILNSSLKIIKDRVDITIYFVPGTSETDINNVEQLVQKIPEIKSVKYISQEEALIKFKEEHSNDYLTLQALDELSSNPLGASLNIKAVDPSQYESISNYFKDENVLSKDALTVIDSIDYHQNKVLIDRLTSIINGIRKLGIILSLLFIFISFLITFNTIGLVIYMSREDIGVMKLVGARNKFIRDPFIIYGIIIGLIASIFTIILFLPISYWLGKHMSELLNVDLFSYYKINFFQLFMIDLISGILVGIISSILACNRYLRK
jgi:cell division transport system permease protein